MAKPTKQQQIDCLTKQVEALTEEITLLREVIFLASSGHMNRNEILHFIVSRNFFK